MGRQLSVRVLVFEVVLPANSVDTTDTLLTGAVSIQHRNWGLASALGNARPGSTPEQEANMLRATRHRHIIELIRKARVPITAEKISAKLEVTVRTIYRDVSALIDDGVPIQGEAGVGYVMKAGYDLPPLMFTAPELEALMLGARLVSAQADDETARAADDVIAKISAAIPASLHPVLVDAPLYAASARLKIRDQIDLGGLREALRSERKVRITYANELGEKSERTIWPLSIGYFENRRMIVAWCELRGDYRHFRTDRIEALETTTESLPKRRALLLATWRERASKRYRGLMKR